ncbi:hypothetical protein K438DRAFT_2008590 [Mycena galopus ATCC 62051]|nr:hypothetical protein K438DRAFT_2008590 [Mycena galopus ATCC 62051]
MRGPIWSYVTAVLRNASLLILFDFAPPAACIWYITVFLRDALLLTSRSQTVCGPRLPSCLAADPLRFLRLVQTRSLYVIVFRHALPLTYHPLTLPRPQVFVCGRRLAPRFAANPPPFDFALLAGSCMLYVVTLFHHASLLTPLRLLTSLGLLPTRSSSYVIAVFRHLSLAADHPPFDFAPSAGHGMSYVTAVFRYALLLTSLRLCLACRPYFVCDHLFCHGLPLISLRLCPACSASYVIFVVRQASPLTLTCPTRSVFVIPVFRHAFLLTSLWLCPAPPGSIWSPSFPHASSLTSLRLPYPQAVCGHRLPLYLTADHRSTLSCPQAMVCHCFLRYFAADLPSAHSAAYVIVIFRQVLPLTFLQLHCPQREVFDPLLPPCLPADLPSPLSRLQLEVCERLHPPYPPLTFVRLCPARSFLYVKLSPCLFILASCRIVSCSFAGLEI